MTPTPRNNKKHVLLALLCAGTTYVVTWTSSDPASTLALHIYRHVCIVFVQFFFPSVLSLESRRLRRVQTCLRVRGWIPRTVVAGVSPGENFVVSRHVHASDSTYGRPPAACIISWWNTTSWSATE